MIKKYYILVLTFLCILCGQLSYGQDVAEGDTIDGGNALLETGDWGDSEPHLNEISHWTNEDGHYFVLLENSDGSHRIQESYYNPETQEQEFIAHFFNDSVTTDFASIGTETDLTELEFYSHSSPSEDLSGSYVPLPSNDPLCTITSCPIQGYVVVNCECVCPEKTKGIIADLVYDTLNGLQKDPNKLPSNVTIVPPPSFLDTSTNSTQPLEFTNPNTGFNSTLYRVDNGNGNIEYVYATAGTDDILDAITDYQQAFDQWTSQYQQSRENAVKLAIWAADNGYTLSFTGHSLGGGLANVNALATGLKATLYNPAGLSQGTIDDTDLNLNMGNQGNVTAYVVSGEPVNILNGLLNTPIRAGTIKNIGEPVTNYIAATLVTIWSFTPAEIKLHLISTVKALLDCNM